MPQISSLPKLKEHVVSYLKTCDGKRALKDTFWTEFTCVTGYNVVCKHYGVKRMDKVFDLFKDVLKTDERNVYLIADLENSIVVEISDSEEDDSVVFLEEVSKDRNQQGNTAAASFLPSGSMDNQPPKDTGFISFSDNPSIQPSQPLASHSRYGLNMSRPPVQPSASQGTPTSQTPTMQGSPWRPPNQGQPSFPPSFLMQQAQFPMSAPNMTLQAMRQNRPWQPMNQYGLQQQMTMAPNMQQNRMAAPQQMSAFASPALLGPSQSMPSGTPQTPSMSQWPKPKYKVGPPPGTKITEEVEEVSVTPLNLPRHARLQSEMVNSEVEQCIDVLAKSKEHVSLERIEMLLMKKFQVQHFRNLNLSQRHITQLSFAFDHSRLLCKIQAYVQNFTRSRSMCTLYELQECCVELDAKEDSFEKLKLGPLQKMPVVYDLFKFPLDEYIPEITSLDILEHLDNYLTKYNKWKQRTELTDFMNYLVDEVYKVETAFSLGLRITSLPLAIQTLKKAKHDASVSRKTVIANLNESLVQDINEAFANFRASILQSNQNESSKLRLHYMNLDAVSALREIIAKYEILMEILGGDLSPTMKRKTDRFIHNFEECMRSLQENEMHRQLFHLALSLSNNELQETASEFMEGQLEKQKEVKESSKETQKKKTIPSKKSVIEKLSDYLNRCSEQRGLRLSDLSRIEEKILDDFSLAAFSDMCYGHFLKFLLDDQKIKGILDESGGTILGSNSSSHDGESSFKPTLTELLEFVCQAKAAGLSQPAQIETAICEQFQVANVKLLGHGNISRLFHSADKKGKHSSKDFNCYYEAALCGKQCPSTNCTESVGIMGGQSRECALACLTSCPLLEDMAEWTNWSLIFQPQHGKLKNFIEKHGGSQCISIDGGKQTASSDIMAIETEPGKFLKLTCQSSPKEFAAMLNAGDPKASAGHLVSIIVANKGVQSAPTALLANYLKSKLIELHAQKPVQFSPGGPPLPGMYQEADPAVQFAFDMLLHLPLRICVSIANQMILEPLSQVVGSAKSKAALLACCKFPWQYQRLILLGCLLGLPEWRESMHLKMQFPSSCVEDVVFDDLLEPVVEDEVQEKDEEDESDIEFLSDEEDRPNVEGPEHKSDDQKSQEEMEASDKGMDEEATTEAKAGADSGEKNEEESEEESDSSSEESSDAEGSKSGSDVAPFTMDGDSSDESSGSEEDEEEEEKEKTHEDFCKECVENIRADEFGEGIQLDEKGQKLLQVQQERQGRMVHRLSVDLYSKDTHFVLELIQNADDNAYPEDIVPAVRFVINGESVSVMNNEKGFEADNIKALCDVGKSTKGKHKYGYIGQKGIGFKSVFRVTSRPEIHSNGFHICFDVKSGPLGYIMPHWIDACAEDESWKTNIVLPWTEEIRQQIHTHAARFNDIQPSLLLFLHRLQKIEIDNQIDGSKICMQRRDLDHGEVQIAHSGKTDRWLVVKKMLDASQISLQAKSGVEVESTEIALAFPLQNKSVFKTNIKPKHLPVFAFLPLRSYGFRFILQGDFDVPSSREDVDRDSSWNQWLRGEVPMLFIEALDAFKNLPGLNAVESVMSFLQFVPMEGEVFDFFKPVASHILAQLRAKECIPVCKIDSESGDISWKTPSKTVISRDPLMWEVVNPDLLRNELDLYYVTQDVASILDDSLVEALGVGTVNTDMLLLLGRSLAPKWNSTEGSDHVTEIAKWLACVYRSLDHLMDNESVMNELRKVSIIPIGSGRLVSTADVTTFLLSEEPGHAVPGQSSKKQKKGAPKDPFTELKKDLNLIHEDLTHTPDEEVNSQVTKLLLLIGVKRVTSHDLIESHIMPVLESNLWKEKSRDVLINYLVYIKAQLDSDSDLLDMARLKKVARLATNRGMKLPSEEDVHFSPVFGNALNLQQLFPGVEWTFVDSAYLGAFHSPNDVHSWGGFLSSLGVSHFLVVRRNKLKLDKNELGDTVWSGQADTWPDSPDGYIINDAQCDKFGQLAALASRTPQMMTALYQQLDAMWQTHYNSFVSAQVTSGSGHNLKTIESSFATHLKTLPWVPAAWREISDSGDSLIQQQSCLTASQLYVKEKEVTGLLSHTVKYLDVMPAKGSPFTKFLQVKQAVSKEEMKDMLISWGQRPADAPNTPRPFTTTPSHILQVYKHLSLELPPKQVQDMFHENAVIFVPALGTQRQSEQLVKGEMMKREEVWWADRKGLFTRHRNSLEVYRSPLAKHRIMVPFYANMEEMFHHARLREAPTTTQLADLLKHLATVKAVNENETLEDALLLFSEIGSDLSIMDEMEGGVSTQKASLARVDLLDIRDLLSSAAVFPTKLHQWVSLSDNPMISDSTELEELFYNKPGVHFINLDLLSNKMWASGKKAARNMSNALNNGEVSKESVHFFLNLFKEIKPLSDCVQSTEITEGFQPYVKGQTFLHNTVSFVQQFLYFLFPDVYENIKQKKAPLLKYLVFTQVRRLEVRYELKHCTDVNVIREEKCIFKDHHFYLQEKYVGNQKEINLEVAKFFSNGNEECISDLRNFLTQAAQIISGSSDETIEDLFSRQKRRIRTLPEDEEGWEIPPPVIEAPPEPEPLPVQEEQMVYARALSMPSGSIGEEGESKGEGLKAWPPASNLDADRTAQGNKSNNAKPLSSTMWPPPRAADYMKTCKVLPSNIKIEQQAASEQPITASAEASSTEKSASLSRQESQTSNADPARKPNMSRQESQVSNEDYARKQRQGHADKQGPSRQTSTTEARTYEDRVGDESRRYAPSSSGSELPENATEAAGEKRKRKLTEGSATEEESHSAKRLNSQESYEAQGKQRAERSLGEDGFLSFTPTVSSNQSTEQEMDDASQESSKNLPTAIPGIRDDKPSEQRRNLQFRIASNLTEDVSYHELANGDNLTRPDYSLAEHAQAKEIGRWGEVLVYDYLNKQKETMPSIDQVVWANKDAESGSPYDFEIVFKTDNPDEPSSIFIEVKATVSVTKALFEVSSKEVEFACQHKDNYEIFRVFGAGKEEWKLLRIDNIADHMLTKRIKLLMLI